MPNYLQNDRIYLRVPEPEDVEIMYLLENDPEYWEVSSITVPYSRYALRQYIENSQSDIFIDRQLRLMIIDKENQSIIGSVDITDFDPLHNRAAVGIAIDKDFRRQGLAHQALTLLCEYVFRFLHLKQLYAYIPADNEASIRLFTSCGFTQTACLKDWLCMADGYRDALLVTLVQ